MTQRSFSGSGADEDIVVSSARAYVSALNKMIPYITATSAANSIHNTAQSRRKGLSEVQAA